MRYFSSIYLVKSHDQDIFYRENAGHLSNKNWKLPEYYEDSSFSLFLLSATANIAPREKSQQEKSFCRKVLKVPTVYTLQYLLVLTCRV